MEKWEVNKKKVKHQIYKRKETWVRIMAWGKKLNIKNRSEAARETKVIRKAMIMWKWKTMDKKYNKKRKQ